MKNHFVKPDGINGGPKLSNRPGRGSYWTNATVVVAYAYLVHELQPVVLAVLKAAGHG